MDEWSPAFFNPPLAAERNGWILNQLRRHSIRTVLDVGCGEGSLLRSLCEPSIDRYDPRIPLSADITARPLYPSLLGGIDIDEQSVRLAAERTLPRTFDPDASRFSANGRPCWDELRLQFWHGGIETPNEGFLDRYQCFVSTEVVEHVPENILRLFLPLVLGYYRPEFLLLTTPNYLYNELFSPPGIPDEEGFPDPTGRTTRVFRHSDHKREWTPSEWQEWCKLGAAPYGYTVELNSIGWLGRPDPYGRAVQEGGTLTAVFHRVEALERILPTQLLVECTPSPALTSDVDITANSTIAAPSLDLLPSLISLPLQHDHKLIADYNYEVHPSAGAPAAPDDILQRVRKAFTLSPDNELLLEFLWLKNGIDVACGGLPRVLVDALLMSPVRGPTPSTSGGDVSQIDPEWEITQGPASDLLSWLVLWRKWVPPPAETYPTGEEGIWDGSIDEDEYEWPNDQQSHFAPERLEEWTAWGSPNPASDDWGRVQPWDVPEIPRADIKVQSVTGDDLLGWGTYNRTTNEDAEPDADLAQTSNQSDGENFA